MITLFEYYNKDREYDIYDLWGSVKKYRLELHRWCRKYSPNNHIRFVNDDNIHGIFENFLAFILEGQDVSFKYNELDKVKEGYRKGKLVWIIKKKRGIIETVDVDTQPNSPSFGKVSVSIVGDDGHGYKLNPDYPVIIHSERNEYEKKFDIIKRGGRFGL